MITLLLLAIWVFLGTCAYLAVDEHLRIRASRRRMAETRRVHERFRRGMR